MSDTDKYESDESEASTASTTAGTKYYQISIPNYYLVAADGGTSSTSTGSSFLRLGSFPTSASDASNPSGFTSSYVLAKLVGDKTSIVSAESQDLDPSANPTTPSYNGDSNYLLGFADDTRYRKDDTTATWTARRDETTRLLTKGGWWDHSDGNRISTTSGDKIEIIQGNYKMLVLGRPTQSVTGDLTAVQLASLAAGTLITDVSGGLMVENGPSPTHCIKSIEYIYEDSTDTWEVYQNNGIGNVYSSFYGDTVDIFLGQHKATWTGTVPSTYKAEDSDVATVLDVYKKSLAIRQDLKEVTTDSDPVVIDHVWASKIASYKGSSGNPIPTITDSTYAKSIAGTTTVTGDPGTITSTTTADKKISSSTTSNNDDIVSETYAKKGTVRSTTEADTIVSTTTAGATTVWSHIDSKVLGNIVNGTKAGSMTNMNAAFHFLDLSIGFKTTVAVASTREAYLGGKFSFSLGVASEVFVGQKGSYRFGPSLSFSTSPEEEMGLLKSEIFAQLLLGI